jgi:hypothetical protein
MFHTLTAALCCGASQEGIDMSETNDKPEITLYRNNMVLETGDIVAVAVSTIEAELNGHIAATQKALKDRKLQLTALNKHIEAEVKTIAELFIDEVKGLHAALAARTGSSGSLVFTYRLVGEQDKAAHISVSTKISVPHPYHRSVVDYADSEIPLTPELKDLWDNYQTLKAEMEILAGDLARLQGEKRNVPEMERAIRGEIAITQLSQTPQGLAHLDVIQAAAKRRSSSFTDLFVLQQKQIEG